MQLDWGDADGRFVLKVDVANSGYTNPTSSDVFNDIATFRKANNTGTA